MTTATPHTDKFLKWYRNEQQNGLVDIKFEARDMHGATQESFFAEVNAMLEAPSVEASDL